MCIIDVLRLCNVNRNLAKKEAASYLSKDQLQENTDWKSRGLVLNKLLELENNNNAAFLKGVFQVTTEINIEQRVKRHEVYQKKKDFEGCSFV